MKKVHFSDVIIFHKVGMTIDDRSARDGLQDARDRERFQMRIHSTNLLLSDILRKKIETIKNV